MHCHQTIFSFLTCLRELGVYPALFVLSYPGLGSLGGFELCGDLAFDHFLILQIFADCTMDSLLELAIAVL